VGERIVALLGGSALHVAPGAMPLYHAAAVMASNYVTGLIDAAAILMKAAGIGERTALGALAPLIRAGVENTLALGPEQALTGPIERGDLETVRLHLRSLSALAPSVSGLLPVRGSGTFWSWPGGAGCRGEGPPRRGAAAGRKVAGMLKSASASPISK